MEGLNLCIFQDRCVYLHKNELFTVDLFKKMNVENIRIEQILTNKELKNLKLTSKPLFVKRVHGWSLYMSKGSKLLTIFNYGYGKILWTQELKIWFFDDDKKIVEKTINLPAFNNKLKINDVEFSTVLIRNF